MLNIKSSLAKNTFMVMILNISKIALPFLTLPYLTRVLSTDTYGSVAYIKAVMGYMQTLVDFGFLLSATKYVANAHGDKEKIGQIVGDNIVSKLLIALFGFIILIILTLSLKILKENWLFTFLSYITIVLSIFLLDFLFMGIEKMEIITYRFLIMKGLSTILTFILVKNDSTILWIPTLDIISSLVAVYLVSREVKKENIILSFSGIKNSLNLIKESFVYFFANVASISFNVFNTIVMGAFMTTTDVAYWSICIQCISAVQTLLNPISDAIYPEMIRTKSKKKLMKIIKIFIPIIIAGSIVAYILTPLGLYIVGGEKYLPATNIFRILIPVIFFSFLAIMFGWPALGAINRAKETTITTVISVCFQIIAILFLAFSQKITLFNIAFIRCITELLLFLLRFYYFRKYNYEFSSN